MKRLISAATAYIWARFAWEIVGFVLLVVAVVMTFVFFGALESFKWGM